LYSFINQTLKLTLNTNKIVNIFLCFLFWFIIPDLNYMVNSRIICNVFHYHLCSIIFSLLALFIVLSFINEFNLDWGELFYDRKNNCAVRSVINITAELYKELRFWLTILSIDFEETINKTDHSTSFLHIISNSQDRNI
jgi:TM2 domain-containing membrane protein YozV